MNDLPSVIPSIAGIVLSLAFKYIPGLAPWYDAQSAQTKSLVMLASLVGAVVVIMVAGCANLAFPGVCEGTGWRDVLQGFVLALVATTTANQATYLVTRKL